MIHLRQLNKQKFKSLIKNSITLACNPQHIIQITGKGASWCFFYAKIRRIGLLGVKEEFNSGDDG